MTFAAATILRRAMLITAVLCILTACGNSGYRPKSFPTEGKQAFEDYLEKYATRYEDLNGNIATDLAYLSQWATKGQKLRTNITGAWCILATNMIWLGNEPTFFFVVYQTKDEKWHISASDGDYKKVGCFAV